MGIPRPRNYLSNFFNVAVSHLALMYAYNFSSSRIGARLEPHHHDALSLPLPLLGVKGFIYPMEKIRRSREAALNNFSPPSSLTLPPPPPPSASRPFNRMRFTPGDSSSLFLRSEARGMERIDGYVTLYGSFRTFRTLLENYFSRGEENFFRSCYSVIIITEGETSLRKMFAGWIDGGESVEERC